MLISSTTAAPIAVPTSVSMTIIEVNVKVKLRVGLNVRIIMTTTQKSLGNPSASAIPKPIADAIPRAAAFKITSDRGVVGLTGLLVEIRLVLSDDFLRETMSR